MTQTSEKIIKTIKESHIEPDPRWKFLIKNDVLWAAFAISLLVGAVAFAVILEMLVTHDWDIYPYLHRSLFSYVTYSLPYVWFVCLVSVALIAFFNFTHIKGWYHHRVYLVVLCSVAGSIFLGSAMFALGFGKLVDQALAESIPYYDMLKVGKKDIWVHPEEGLLGGTVVSVGRDGTFIVRDFSGKTWTVRTFISQPGNVLLPIRSGDEIKMIGQEEEGGFFQADEIRSRALGKPIRRQSKDDNGGICGTRGPDMCGN